MRPKNLYVREEVMSAPKQLATPLLAKYSETDISDSSIYDASKINTNEGSNKKIFLFSIIGFAVLTMVVTGYFAFKK